MPTPLSLRFTSFYRVFYFAIGNWINDRVRVRQTLSLGLVYLTGLFAYQLFALILADENGIFCKILTEAGHPNLKDRITLLLHLGMLSGAITWSIVLLRRGVTLNLVLKWSVLLSAVAIGGKIALVFYAGVLTPVQLAWSLAVARFWFGFGFSASLAIALTLISERYPAYMRTWSATLVCTMGMLGPLLAIGLMTFLTEIAAAKFSPRVTGGLLLMAVFLLLMLLKLAFPKDAGRVDETEPVPTGGHAVKPVRFILGFVFRDKNTSRIFWACVAMGLSISIFSDLMNMLPRMIGRWELTLPSFFSLPDLAMIYLCRYTGMAIGTLYAGWESDVKHSRKKIIYKLLWLQMLALFLLLSPTFSWMPKPDGWLYCAVIFFSGFVNGFWIILLLHTAEQFARPHRRIVNLLVLNLTRFGAFFIILLNNFARPDWFNEFPAMLFFYGAAFISIGLFTAPFLPDNFGGNAVEPDYDTQTRFFDNQQLRSEILRIPGETWLSEAPSPFLNEAKKILFGHLSEKFRENFYNTGLFFSQNGNRYLIVNENILKIAGYRENEREVRQETYEYRNSPVADGYKALAFQEGMQRIILDKDPRCHSLTLWMMPDPKIGSLVLWFGGPGQEMNEADRSVEGLRAFNLAKITFREPVDLKTYTSLVSDPDMTMPERYERLEALYLKTQFDQEEWARFFQEKENPDAKETAIANGIRHNLLLHRLNAELYEVGAYYAYYLKSYNILNDLKGVISLKMATALRERYIRELRGLLTFLLLQRSAAMLQRSNELIVHEERHANKHELDALVGRLEELKSWFRRLRKRAEKEGFSNLDPAEFETNFEPALRASRHMRDLTDFNNLLMREKDLNEPETYAGEKESLFTRFGDVVAQENLNLEDFLIKCADDLKYMPNAIAVHSGIGEEETRNALREKCRKQLEKSIRSAFAGKKIPLVRANPIGLRVVLHELLKNAGQHADLRDPAISVRIEVCDNGCLKLHLVNNWYDSFRQNAKAREALFEAIQDRIEHERSRSGLRTVQRFLDCPWFSYGERFLLNREGSFAWRLDCADMRNPEAGETDIFLVIPASATVLV